MLGEEVTPEEGGYDPLGLAWQEEPRPDQLPMGSSRYSIFLLYFNVYNTKSANTWANI